MIKSSLCRNIILSLIWPAALMVCGTACYTGFDNTRIQSLDIEAKMYYQQGVKLSKEKKSREAIGAFATSVRIDPNAAAYCGLGIEYYRLGNYDMSVLYANRATMINPKYPLPYMIRGESYYQMKDYDKALKNYLRALQLDPGNADCYYNIGQVYYKKGLADDALKAYDKAVELNPHHFSSWYNRACIFSQKNDVKEAIASLEKAVAEGFTNVKRMMTDPALANVRTQPEFQSLVSTMEGAGKKPQ